MIQRFVIAAIVAVLALPVQAQEAVDPNPLLSESVGGFLFGLYCAPEPSDVVEAPDTAAGVVNMIETPVFFAESTVVPAELGLGFGIMATMAPGVLADPLEITITHPPYPTNGISVERWQTSIGDDGPGLVGFSFEHQHELVLGDWVVEGAFKDELLFRITFQVVPPDRAGNLSGQCAGRFMS